MIRRLFILIGVLFALSSCGDDVIYRIDGKLENLENETIFAVFEGDDYKVIDTVVCNKPGEFSLLQRQEGFDIVTLFFNNRTRWTTIYLEPKEKITVTGDVNYPSLLSVKGGRINNKLTSLHKDIAPLLKEQEDIARQLRNPENSQLEEIDLTSSLINVNHSLAEYAAGYIAGHTDEPASLVLLQQYFTDPDDTRKLDEFLVLLSPKLKENSLFTNLEEYSRKVKRTSLGAEAPGFSVKNIYGKPVSLDSFPERYVLLTFTAPWCDMCQTEDLYLDELATKYPKDKIDLLLVSLDDDQREVRDVLKKDSIKWNLVTDSAGQAAMLLELYNVSSLPRSFLIDEEGKIILKTDNGLELKQTLEKLID